MLKINEYQPTLFFRKSILKCKCNIRSSLDAKEFTYGHKVNAFCLTLARSLIYYFENKYTCTSSLIVLRLEYSI